MANARDQNVARVKNLESKSFRFATQMRDLLNSTICEHATFGVSVDARHQLAFVGTNVTKRNVQSAAVALRSAAKGQLWLDVSCTLVIENDENELLTVQSSVFAIKVGPEVSDAQDVFHYDFERDKPKYAEAHIQVHGRHEAFEAYARTVGNSQHAPPPHRECALVATRPKHCRMPRSATRSIFL